MADSSKSRATAAARTISEQCLGMRARSIGRALNAIFDNALRDLGITGSQLTLLVAIKRHGSVSPTDLGRSLMIEKSTLSRNLGRLQSSDLVAAEPGRDNRSTLLSITEEGEQLLVDALPRWRKAQKSAKQALGDDGANALVHAADSLP